MAYENFIVERAGAIATVYFNRPEKLNPINGKLLTEMLEVVKEFRDDEETRVVVLTGKGRSFCAGADIGGLLAANAGPQAQRAQTDAGRLRTARTGWRLMDEWERLDQVTIAAVNGFAIGGGLSLAMACDFRIAAAGARIWIPEVALGVPYMWGSVTRLVNLVGMSKAKEMIMTCDEVTAEEALKIGLVNQVVPLEQLSATALAFAGKLVSKPPMALRRTKDFFKALGNGRLGDITYADGYLGLSCLASDDMSEAMAAFKEKRPGRYRGR
jgi:enoyl-CoA hydratase/carnithine racemase